MVKYKILFNGEEEDDVFDSLEAAEDYAVYLCGCSSVGAEILNLSNPGDYDYDDDWESSDEYEIFEVED